MRKRINLKMFRNVLFFVLLIFLTFYLLFKDQSIEEIVSTIKQADVKFLLLGAFLMLCYHITEGYNVRGLLLSLGEKKISILKGLKFTLIGFFFSSITPAATGGQPIEIYYMNKEGISAPKATMSSLIMLCGFQISTITFGVISAITHPGLLKGYLFWLFLLGLTINGFALSVLLFCVFSQKLSQRVVRKVTKVLKKLNVKTINERLEKLNEGLEKYNECSLFVKSHLKTFFIAILKGFVQIAFYYSIPYCIYRAFGFNSLSFFDLFAMQAVLFTTVSGLPLPGAVGISETVFLSIFEGAFGKAFISGSMLLSRGVTFYLYVIISLIVVVYNAIKMKNVESVIDETVIEFERKERLEFA